MTTLVVAIGLAPLAGCDFIKPVACRTPEPGLRVAVTDVGGAPLCDATVTARDGSFFERLFAYNCVFTGAVQRSGTYRVIAALGERRTEVQTFVTGEECKVRTADIKILLPD